MKGYEILFEIIYIHCGLWVWFQCYTGEGVKLTEKVSFKRTGSQEEIQTA